MTLKKILSLSTPWDISPGVNAEGNIVHSVKYSLDLLHIIFFHLLLFIGVFIKED